MTHITNGCYRLHPVEWNIGEAAGALAAHAFRPAIRRDVSGTTPSFLQTFKRLCSAKA